MEAAGKRWITYPSRASEVRIFNMSDLHIGVKACDEKKLIADVRKIRDDPHALWFGGGDTIDAISPKDKRFNTGEISPRISVADLARLGARQMEMAYEILSPIKHKCLGLAFGNHEAKYMGQTEQARLHHWLCVEMGVPDLGYCCFMDTIFVRQAGPTQILNAPPEHKTRHGSSWRVRHFIHHGAGSAATPGGKLNRLIKFMCDHEADCYWMGHVHDQKAQRMVTLGMDETASHIVQREKLGVISGSYLRTYKQGCSGYGEQKGYSPTPVGAVAITFRPDKRTFRSEV
jgi:hypothetical protein